MALGTITQLTDNTFGSNLPTNLGSLKFTLSTVVGDSAYSAGGTAITAAQFGLTALTFAVVVQVQGSAANNGAIQATYNNTTGKLQCWASSGVSPVGLVEAGSVNLSGITVTILAFGY